MRSRAALLPTPGDPFLLNFWLKYYKRFWIDEVDCLYVYVNSSIEEEAVNYMRNLVRVTPKAVWIYSPTQIEHGAALKRMVDLSTHDHLVLLEDDGFIFRPGKIDACFKRIESGEVDVVGSKRGSCSQWLYDMASSVYGIDNSGYGDNGPNFWPNFFFAKREHLARVTNFGARAWEAGELVETLGSAPSELQAADTFVEGSLQIRKMGLRVGYEDQYHLSADDMEDYNTNKGIFDGRASWMHVGSLSSGINGMLVDSQGRNLGRRKIQKPGEGDSPWRPQTEGEKMEIERRLAWLSIAHQYSKPERLTDLRNEYSAAIARVVDTYGLSGNRIAKRKAIYAEYLP